MQSTFVRAGANLDLFKTKQRQIISICEGAPIGNYSGVFKTSIAPSLDASNEAIFVKFTYKFHGTACHLEISEGLNQPDLPRQ